MIEADCTLPLIEFRDVSRNFITAGGIEVVALREVSFELYSGEFVAIMGPSGSGKTTLMNLLGCLDQPSTGTYTLCGREVTSFDSDGLAWLRREVFGFIFQSYNLLGTATALENVMIPAVYAGKRPGQRLERARRLLTDLGLADRCEHRPSQLSGGQQQRVSVARALMNGGQILLADEPTGALDSHSGTELLNILVSLARQGHTVIVNTHDPSVAGYADRRIDLLDGKIVHDSGHCQTLSRAGSDTLQELSARISQGKSNTSTTNIWEASRIAFRSLRANLFRTGLTLLGVVIGVASVIITLAIGEGARARLVSKIDALGANTLVVWVDNEEFPAARLTFEDSDAIGQVPNVQAVLPELSNPATVRYGSADYQMTVTAVAAEYPSARVWKLASGTFFTRDDSEYYAPLAVLGAAAVTKLFGDGVDPLGEYILIEKVPFLVIGTMVKKGNSVYSGYDQDDVILVPLKTGAMRLFGAASLSGLTVLTETSDYLSQTEDELRAMLKHRHGTVDFEISNSTEMLENMDRAMSVTTLILGAIGGISLLVGGIGIMNIMLVSVTERTREIGIRMATGARQSDIMVQFLVESIVVSGLGGVIGVIFGMSVGCLLGAVFPILPMAFIGFPALIAFSCAVATGLVFGFAPARNAARLDPVVALATD